MSESVSFSPVPLDRIWPAIPTSISQIRAAHRAFAREAGASQRTTDGVALAVSEAAANAVIHAFGDGRSPGSITTSATLVGDRLMEHVVSDDGCGMDADSDSSGLGLGLALIAQVSERVEMRSAPGEGTELRMEFRL